MLLWQGLAGLPLLFCSHLVTETLGIKHNNTMAIDLKSSY